MEPPNPGGKVKSLPVVSLPNCLLVCLPFFLPVACVPAFCLSVCLPVCLFACLAGRLLRLTVVSFFLLPGRLHIVCACSSARSQGNAEHATSVVQNDDEDSKDGFYDLETSDKQLRDLEERIATFCSSLSPLPLFSHSAPPRHRPQVMELKRFEVQVSPECY